jgi:hypothetical protein
MSERTDAACGLVLMLAVSALIAAVLIGWAECGRACGAADKPVKAAEQRPRGGR